MTYDYLIIGAGISGVTFARLLQLFGVSNFIILEAEPTPGGLCRSVNIDGHFLDIGGGHFLCTKHQEVYDFIFSHISKDQFDYYQRISKIRVLGCEVDYPLENNLWQLPDMLRENFLASVVSNPESRGVEPPANFADWIRWRFGDRLADNYMIPYNEKIWGIPLHELSIEWLHKLPRLNAQEIIAACQSSRPYRNRMPSHEGFYYPKHGGFQLIFDAIYSQLPPEAILLSYPLTRLVRNDDYWLANHEIKARRVVNTAPWSSLRESVDFPTAIRDSIDLLKNNSIVVSLYERAYSTPAHWIYEPLSSVPHHREFMIGNFSRSSKTNGIYTETNSQRWRKNSDALYEVQNNYAYPIPTRDKTKAISNILDWGCSQNLYGLGRWGQWEYFNSDICIYEAMKLHRALQKEHVDAH